MKPRSYRFIRRVIIVLSLLGWGVGLAGAEDWPGWRGPRGDGTSWEQDPPTHWSGTENVVWRIEVPGEGHSSPIIWQDRVFLTTAIADRKERLLLCFERQTGTLLWQQVVLRASLEPKNRENSYASATPVTDGEKVYVTFLDGDEVLVAAYDFSGKQVWSTRPGTFKSQWGFSHPPVLFEDKVIVSCYSKGENFVVALSRADGRAVWKTPGKDPSQSYSPPLIREMAGRMQMVIPGNKAVTSYDPRTGGILWYVDTKPSDAVATPVYHEKSGLVLSGTSWPKKILFAIKPDGEGNVTANKVVWTTDEGAPYVPSPIAVGDWFFTSSFADKAAYCYQADTGEVIWKQSMGLHHASPVSANGLVYFLNDDGVMHVVKAGPAFELVARNELGERTYASPVFAAGQLFLRSFNHLYCIGKPTTSSARPQPTGKPMAGAYYYPWYQGGNEWRKVMREHLVPPQRPAVGLYRSSDPDVIGAHIAQSVRGGISFWAMSWWGPGRRDDVTFRDAILKHPDAAKLKYAILYESTGRFGRFSQPSYDHWIADLTYLSEQYFDHPQYLRINGKPVVFVYLSREYFRNRGQQALQETREKFPNLYLVGDDVFGVGYRAEWAKNFDAVTAYDVYGQSVGRFGGTRRAIEFLADNYRHAKQQANSAGTAFMPAIAPGYNDTAVREGHPGRARYFTDQEGSQEGDVFRAMIREVALPNLDPRCDNVLMITSFNEWYEDTQIEATSGTAPPSDHDDSESGKYFTGGDRYVDYGTLYLDILREGLE